MDPKLLGDWMPYIVTLGGLAVAWGDLRRQVRGLAEEVRRQNGRLGKVEGQHSHLSEVVARIRGFLNANHNHDPAAGE